MRPLTIGWYLVGLMVITATSTHGSGSWIGFDKDQGKEPRVSVRQDERQAVVKIEVPGVWSQLVSVQGQSFTRLQVPGAGRWSELGKPQTPAIVRLLAIPANASFSWEVAIEGLLTEAAPAIEPVQRPLPDSGRATSQEFMFDSELYESQKSFPERQVLIEGPFCLRDVLFLRVIVMPVAYDFNSGSINLTNTFTITINFTDPQWSGLTLSQSFKPTYSTTFLNFQEYANLAAAHGMREVVQCTMLVIARDSLALGMVPYLAWKNKKGIDTPLALMSEIGTTDVHVYNYINQCYTSWEAPPSYVLLVGDVGQVPAHYGSADPYGGGQIATDHYYSCMDDDIYSDVLVGRFSVTSLGEVTTLVDKSVSYERVPYLDEQQWYTNSFVFYGLERPQWLETAQIIRTILQGAGFTVTLYNDGSHGTTQVRDSFNNGVSYATYRGHGDVTEWSNVPFTNSNTQALANYRKMPVIIGPTCESGHYDAPSTDCFAECMLKTGAANQVKAAIEYFGASRVSYTGYNDELARGFYKALFLDGLHHYAAATNKAKLYMAAAYPGDWEYVTITTEMFNNFGDPELPCFGGAPTQMTVQYEETIPIGIDSTTVIVQDGRGVVANALVCVRKQDEFYATATTNNFGIAEVPITPLTPGTIELTVTAWTRIPFEATAEAIATGCGVVRLGAGAYSCSDEVGILLLDADLNSNPSAIETGQVVVRSTSDPVWQPIVVTEDGQDSFRFVGSVQLDESQSGGGWLKVAHEETIEVRYEDADCDGAPQEVVATAQTDCAGPAFAERLQFGLSDSEISIYWTSDEPATTKLFYGEQVPPTQIYEDSVLSQQHTVTLDGLEGCHGYFYALAGADACGNEGLDDNEGYYYGFVTKELITVLSETMTTNPQWVSSGGQWAWGTPTGGGGQYGGSDPTAGYSGSQVYGYNLGGDYTNNMQQYHLTTPPLDCSAAVNTTLSFYRWLGVEQRTYDQASILISTNGVGWIPVWNNPDTETADRAWVYQEFDISDIADHQPLVYVRWTLGPTDSGWTYCGWNIDDVVVCSITECDITPTPRPTYTPTPTLTPTATLTPTPTLEPTVPLTPTAIENYRTLTIGTNLLIVKAGDRFILFLVVTNNAPQVTAEQYVVLDVAGNYWFWPAWDQEVTGDVRSFPAFEQTPEVILDFIWPEGAGAAQGIVFWAALLEPGTVNLVTDVASCSFSFE